MSRVTILAIGSRGDFEPYLALAETLLERGHRVTLAGGANFRARAEAAGCRYFDVRFNPRERFEHRSGQAMLGSERRLLSAMRHMRDLMAQDFASLFDDCLAASADADIVLYSILALPGVHIGEKLGIAALAAYLQPATRTRTLPSVMVPQRLRLGASFNLFSYWLARRSANWLFGPLVSRERARLGLSPAFTITQPSLCLYGFSPSFFPKPYDWPEDHHLTGYWVRHRALSLIDPKLENFLAQGPERPVAIGFGSMADADAPGLAKLLGSVIESLGIRAVVLGGWAGLDSANWPASVCAISEADHTWLFPRVAAVVHHGGAGTTAAALFAGAPSVIVPYFADQFFWAEHAHRQGLAAAALPRKKLTALRLRRALQDALALDRSALDALAQRLQAESGSERAAELIERYARS